MLPFPCRCRCSVLAFLCVVLAASSCGLAAEENGTRVVEDPAGVFSVAFPGTSIQSGGLGKSASEEQQQFTLSTDKGVYMLVYEDFPKLDFSNNAVANSAMQTAREGFRKSLNGELISEERIRLPGTGVNGVEFQLNIPRLNGRSRHRSVAIGHRWYSVLVLGTEEFVQSAEADRFMKSATLVAAESETRSAQRGRTRIRNLVRQRGGN
ncbi:MAG: hypothetical protein NXI04_05205 [Planctomycetaceae bacterium]|nr:hypothetical protein [Planctomycetaceae bacterium]